MNNINKIIFFSIGATIGSLVTWKILKDKYEKIAKEEIESVKNVYKQKNNYQKIENVEIISAEGVPIVTTFENAPNVLLNEWNKMKETKEDKKDEPYTISPEEFGDDADYEKICLTYYTEDSVLTDDQDEVIEDVAGLVGLKSLDSFGEYEDDIVYVRNDKLKCDYEIAADNRKYSDVVNKKLTEEYGEFDD